MQLMQFFRQLMADMSLSAINAGFVTVLVGFTSSVVIVFQAARAVGANEAQISSWILALGVGMGISGIALSIRYRAPITTAWSTSGAAMLVTGANGITLNEAIGAFVVTGILIAISGFTGIFARLMKQIPLSLAAGMLSGVLLQFGIDAFAAMGESFTMVLMVFVCYVVSKTLVPRYAVLVALVVGVVYAASHGLIESAELNLELAAPVFVTPEFSWRALIGVAIPLFVVTMASQNLPGLTVLRASDYRHIPVSPLIGWTGVTTTVFSVFGGYTINLATITSAICVGKEAHPDPNKRYVASIAAGFFYILTGLFGTAVVAMFAAFPNELILAIAGLALLGTIGNALFSAVQDEANREASLVAFLLTASGVSFVGIGSAFWGVVAGAFVMLVKFSYEQWQNRKLEQVKNVVLDKR